MTKDRKQRMELSEEDYAPHHVQEHVRPLQQQKYTTIDLAKAQERTHNGMDTMMSAAHKDHHHQHHHEHHHKEHHLLVPEYIRDSSNFIMDLIEHPDEVFPKTSSVVHLPPTTSSGSGVGQYVVKDALTAELHHFPSSIFQFVQKQGHHSHNQHSHHNQHHLHIVDEAEERAQHAMSPRVGTQNTSAEAPPMPLPLAIHSTVVVTDEDAFTHKHHTPEDFLSINNDFLNTTAAGKAFCDNDAALAVQPTTVQPFPPLSSLLAEPSVAINHSASVLHHDVNNDIMYATAAAAARSTIARKVLPHKKRISHKLKVAQSDADAAELALQHHSAVVDAIIAPVKLTPASDEHLRLPALPPLTSLPPHVVVANTLQFSCELCGHATSSQLDFFAHLKQHYEPTTPDTILAAMKTSLDELGPEKDGLCALVKKPDDSNHDVHQVFQDVHLNFGDFHNVDEADSVRGVTLNHHHHQQSQHHPHHHHQQHQQQHESNQNDDMKILNSNSIDKCISYVHQVESTPLKDIAVDEVEFSDTEDMLEGIRNVVDKVSIEDTCDDIDLMVTPNGLRAPWFANDSFSGISTSLSQIQPESLKIEDPSALIAYTNEQGGSIAKEEKLEKDAQNVHETNEPIFYPKQEEDNNCNDNAITAITTTSFKTENDTTTTTSVTSTMTIKEEEKLPRVMRQKSKAFKKQLPHEEHLQQDFIGSASNSEDGMIDGMLDGMLDENDEEFSPTEDSPTTSQAKKHFICAKCGREFNSSNALKYHHRTHSGFRPHQCDVCGRSFFAHGALKAHIRTHTGDKPFECEHCQRKFRQWGDLKYHTVSIHSEEKSHQCEFCGKAFSRKYSLVLHRRIHTSERNYTCEFCSKTFRASSYLQNHRKIHTGEKPHECTVCGKKFRVSGDLRRHTQIHQRTDLKCMIKTEEVDYIEEVISAEEKKVD